MFDMEGKRDLAKEANLPHLSRHLLKLWGGRIHLHMGELPVRLAMDGVTEYMLSYFSSYNQNLLLCA